MAAQTVNYGNGKLPFDILGVIFRLYLDNESLSYPLETLLLVCRAWHSTALTHKSLWSIFNIQAALQWEIDFWKRCISRRLLKSSQDGTIDIEIDSRDCSGAHLSGIISVLAGKSGANVERWPRFCLRTEFTGDSFTQYLCLNTPNLQDLEIHNIDTREQRILPLTPLLRRFHTSRFPAPYPDLSGVTELTISGCKAAGEVDKDAILRADHVVPLSVEDYGVASDFLESSLRFGTYPCRDELTQKPWLDFQHLAFEHSPYLSHSPVTLRISQTVKESTSKTSRS